MNKIILGFAFLLCLPVYAMDSPPQTSPCFSRDNGKELIDLSQKNLRDVLKNLIRSISNEIRESLEVDTGYFLLPIPIAEYLKGKNVLEIGCSSGASVRAFKNAASVSIVEPDLYALALGLDSQWCRQRDAENQKSIESAEAEDERSPLNCAKRMNLDSEWITTMNFDTPWISDSVHIYPLILEDLPETTNQSFDVVAYKDFNLDQDSYDGFFKRLSEITKPDGLVLLQFFADEYQERIDVSKNSLRTDMDKYFAKVELIIDELGHRELVNEASDEWKLVRNDVRFVILKNPKTT